MIGSCEDPNKNTQPAQCKSAINSLITFIFMVIIINTILGDRSKNILSDYSNYGLSATALES